jgi:hypothetical protein
LTACKQHHGMNTVGPPFDSTNSLDPGLAQLHHYAALECIFFATDLAAVIVIPLGASIS